MSVLDKVREEGTITGIADLDMGHPTTPEQRLSPIFEALDERSYLSAILPYNEWETKVLDAREKHTDNGVVDYAGAEAELQSVVAAARAGQVGIQGVPQTLYEGEVGSRYPVEASVVKREPTGFGFETPAYAEPEIGSFEFGNASEHGVPGKGRGWYFTGKGDVNYGGVVGSKLVSVQYFVGTNDDGTVGSLYWREPGGKWREGDYTYKPGTKEVSTVVCTGRECQLHEDDLKAGISYVLKQKPLVSPIKEPAPTLVPSVIGGTTRLTIPSPFSKSQDNVLYASTDGASIGFEYGGEKYVVTRLAENKYEVCSGGQCRMVDDKGKLMSTLTQALEATHGGAFTAKLTPEQAARGYTVATERTWDDLQKSYNMLPVSKQSIAALSASSNIPDMKLTEPTDAVPSNKKFVDATPDQFSQWKGEVDALISTGKAELGDNLFAGKNEEGDYVTITKDEYSRFTDQERSEFSNRGISAVERWDGQLSATMDSALSQLDSYKSSMLKSGYDIYAFADDQRNAGRSWAEIAQTLVNAGFDRANPGTVADTMSLIPPDKYVSNAQYISMNPTKKVDYNRAHPSDPRGMAGNLYYDLAIRANEEGDVWSMVGTSLMSLAEQFTAPKRVPTLIGKAAEENILRIPESPSWMKDIGRAAAIHERPGALINNSVVIVPSDNKGNMGVILDTANNAILNWETKEQLQQQLSSIATQSPDWMRDIGKAGGTAQGAKGAEGSQNIAVNASAETLNQMLGFAKMMPSVPIMVTKSYVDMTEDKKAEAITSMAALGAGVLMFPIQASGQEAKYIGEGDIGSAIGQPVGIALGLIITPAYLKSKAKTLRNITAADTLSAQAHSVEIELPTAWQKGKLTSSAANELVELALKQVIAKYEDIGMGKAKRMPSTIKVQNESGYLTVKVTPEAQVAKLPISSHTTILPRLVESLLKDGKVTIESTAEILDPTAYYGVQPGSGIAITFGGAVPHQNLLPGMKPYTVSTVLSPLEMMGVPMEVRNKLYWHFNPYPARLEMLRLWKEGKISTETFVGSTKTWLSGTEAEVTQPKGKTLIKPPEEMIPKYMHREANGMPYTYVESPIDIRDINGDVVVHAGDRIKRYWVTTEEGAKWAVDNKLKLPSVWDNYKAELLGMTQLSLPRLRRWDIAGIEAESSPNILDRRSSIKTGEIKSNFFDDFVDEQGNIHIRSGEVYKPSKAEQPMKAGAKLGGVEDTARSKIVVIPIDYSTGEIYLGKGGVAQPKYVVTDFGNPLDKYSKVNSFEEQARLALKDNTGIDVPADKLRYIGVYKGKVDVNALEGTRVYIADISGTTPPIKGTGAMKTWQPVNLSLLPKDYYDILMTEKSSVLPDTFAIGDMHGDRTGNRKLVEKEGIVRGGNYVKPDSETVWTGDYSDRGADGVGLIKDVMKWEQQAPSVNSKVTALLGNHDPSLLAAADAMNETYNNLSTGDKAYFNLNYQHNPYEGWNTSSAQWLLQRADATNKPILRTFLAIGGNLKEALNVGRDPTMMAWLRDRPAMAKIGNDLYVHSDGTDFYKAYGNTIDEVNANIQNELQTKEGAYKIYHEMTGNRYWNAKNEDAQISDLLNTYGARRVIHGHTPIASDKPIVYANGKAININNIEYFSNATESQSILKAIQHSTPAEEAAYNARLNQLLSLAIDLTNVGDIDVSPAMYRIIEKVSMERPDLKIPMDKVHKYKGDAVYNVKSLVKTEDKGFATRIQPTIAEINAEGAARELTREKQIKSALPPSIATKLPDYMFDTQTGAIDFSKVNKVVDAVKEIVEYEGKDTLFKKGSIVDKIGLNWEKTVPQRRKSLEHKFVEAGIVDARNMIDRIQRGEASIEELISVAIKFNIPDRMFKRTIEEHGMVDLEVREAMIERDMRVGKGDMGKIEKWIKDSSRLHLDRKPTPLEISERVGMFISQVSGNILSDFETLRNGYHMGKVNDRQIMAWLKERTESTGKAKNKRERIEQEGWWSKEAVEEWKRIAEEEEWELVDRLDDLNRDIVEGKANDVAIRKWLNDMSTIKTGKKLDDAVAQGYIDAFKKLASPEDVEVAHVKSLRGTIDEALSRNRERKGTPYRPEFNKLVRILPGTESVDLRLAIDGRVDPERIVMPRPDEVRPPRTEPVIVDRTVPSRVDALRAETVRAETVRAETVRAETYRAETIRVENPRPTTVPPTRLPPIPPSVPPKLPPASTPIEKYRRLTWKQLEGAVSWKQGWVFITWFPPWGQNDVIHSRQPLPDVKYLTGVGSAAASIIARQGDIPPHIKRDMGIVDVFVSKGKQMPPSYMGDYNTKPLLKFKADPKEKTKYSGIITTNGDTK
jgi:hypothetical protein